MAELNIAKTAVTDLNVTSYETEAQALEHSFGDEVNVDFPNAAKYYGYYKKYGQLKKAIDTLWIYVCGKGYTAETPRQEETLKILSGSGEDTSHALFWNLGVTSMIQGNAFAEIVRDSDSGRLINLKPISPERMRIVYGKNGMIKRYEQMKDGKVWQKFPPEAIFSMFNDRIADEQRGTSVIECCEWVINAMEEARRDYRIVLHRNVVPVRIIEVDTDDTARRNAFMTEYKDAISKGEVLVVPKGTVTITQDTIKIQDPISWIQSLENYFYLAVGIPKVIASPDNLSEGSSKISYLIFEPIYTYRQILLEEDIWQQLGIRVKFNRPASLQDNIQSNEDKNTSQTGFQPKDMAVGIGAE